jgi:hypothetical protein
VAISNALPLDLKAGSCTELITKLLPLLPMNDSIGH